MSQSSAELLVAFAFEAETLSRWLPEVGDEEQWKAHLVQALEREQFKAEWLKWWSTLTWGHPPAPRLVIMGMGPRGEFSLDRVRRAMGQVSQIAADLHASSLAVDVSMLETREVEGLGQAAVEGLALGGWQFAGYHREVQPPAADADRRMAADFYLGAYSAEAFRRGMARGETLAAAQNMVRDLGWTPSNRLYPQKLAEWAEKEAAPAGLEVAVLDEGRLMELGMGAILGVGQGSVHPPRMVILRYRGGGKKTLALVGKGITFDSGGISLKSSAGMEDMKYDMLGAGAVLGALRAIAAEKPAIDVIGIMAIAQNMPSGSASKPGDVLTAFNGKTIEVTNTDAEGRVVLADAVSYAVHLGADFIVETSTLTGAAIIVLGHEASALVASDDHLAEDVLAAGERMGERIWRLPIYPEYKKLYESNVADIKNAPGRDAGTITGGMIIAEFAGEVPFAHLDIAGTAWTNEGPLNKKAGATGVMVRTLTELAQRLAASSG